MSASGQSKGTRYEKLLRINSSNRVKNSGSTDSDFTINVGDNLVKAKTLSLIHASFYNVMYNIFSESQQFNNVFLVTLNANPPVTITITPGQYTTSQLYTAITAAVLASSLAVTWTFTYSSTRNHVSVISSAGAGTYVVTTPPAGFVDGRIVKGSPMTMLGFLSPTTIPNAGGNPLEANDAPTMYRTVTAFLKSSALSPSNLFDEEGKTSNVLMGIPVNVPFGAMQVWESKQDILYQLHYGLPRAINQIDIQLVDHDDYPLDLDGEQLDLLFKVWYDAY